MIFYEDKKYLFWEIFNEKNGTLIRSNIKGTNNDPSMRSFPELIDVGIMGRCDAGRNGVCKKAGVDCYQRGLSSYKDNMILDNYKKIIDEATGKTFQIALGGAGDPNKHEQFEEILKYTRENNIIPNLTTSGTDISSREISLISNYCGAVAVSYYSNLVFGHETNEQTIRTISQLKSLIPTNIHYVISKDSIDEAIYRLENNVWPGGINAIIFLLYKPVGFGKSTKVVTNNEKMHRFMDLIFQKKRSYKIGFDTCFTPVLVDYKEHFDVQSIDSCEAARFSMYIDSDMNAYPCSFDNEKGRYRVSLKNSSIQEVWYSKIFDDFRRRVSNCNSCDKYNICKGGCGLDLGINAGINCRTHN